MEKQVLCSSQDLLDQPPGGGARNLSGQAPGGSQACYTSGSIQLHCSLCPRGVNACVPSQGKNTGVGCHAVLQGNLLDPGIKLASLASPALSDGFFTTEPLGKPLVHAFHLFLFPSNLAPAPHSSKVTAPKWSPSC